MDYDARINEYKQKLKESMDIFLTPFEHYGHIAKAIKNLEEVFYTITGLNPFSRPQGIFIPQRVTVSAAVTDYDGEFPP